LDSKSRTASPRLENLAPLSPAFRPSAASVRLEALEERSLEVDPLRALEELSELPLKREELPQLERPEEDELLESLEEELELPELLEEEPPAEPHEEPFREAPPLLELPLFPELFPELLEPPDPQDEPPAGRDPGFEGAGELEGRLPPQELPPPEEPRLPPPKLLRPPPPPEVLLAQTASGSAARRARMQSIRMTGFIMKGSLWTGCGRNGGRMDECG